MNMYQTNKDEQLIKIGNWISLRLNKYESIITLIFAVLLILKMNTNLALGIFITLSLNSLAILYFFNAFSTPENENAGGIERFVNKLVSFSSSVAIIGILFKIEHWPGHDIMIMLGCTTLLILLPVISIIKSKKPEVKIFNGRLVVRIVLISALGFFLNVAPKETLEKVGLYKKINFEITD